MNAKSMRNGILATQKIAAKQIVNAHAEKQAYDIFATLQTRSLKKSTFVGTSFSCICLCFLLWAEVGCGNPVLIKHCRISWDFGTRQRPVPLSQYRWVLTRTNSCVSAAASPPWWSFTGVMLMSCNNLQCFTHVYRIHTYNLGDNISLLGKLL